MAVQRLISVIRSSPLWCTRPGLLADLEGAFESPAELDLVWYYRNYRNVLGSLPDIRDCVGDYLCNAANALRSPNLAFDELWYRQEYPDIDEQVKVGVFRSGWDHYLGEGARQQYNPTFWFDERWYQKQNAEVSLGVKTGSLLCGFEHYLLYGIRQNLSPSIYFNVDWYRREYLSGPESEQQFPIIHYLLSKRQSRRCPVPFFNEDWYAKQYLGGIQTRAGEKWAAYDHYLLFGRRVGFSPSAYFNEGAYRDSYPEIGDTLKSGKYASGFEHYVNEGAINGFRAFSHLDHGGADLITPELLQLYGESVLLNVKQISQFRQIVECL
jgi:hypothetical protein